MADAEVAAAPAGENVASPAEASAEEATAAPAEEVERPSEEAEVSTGDVEAVAAPEEPLAPAKPLTWAERAALLAAQREESSSSTAPAPGQASGPKLVDVQLAKDGIIDYLLFLAERKAGDDDNSTGEPPELPEQLRKYEGCLDAAIPVTSRVSHTRLGLINMANTCYMNVVIQSLLPVGALMWVLRRCGSADPRRPVLGSLVTLCKEFHTRKPESHGEALNIFLLPSVKDTVASWQRLGAQQDAGEFLYWLLSTLHDETKWKVHCAPTAETESSSAPAAAADAATAEESEGARGGWAHLVQTGRREAEVRSAGLHEDSPVTRIFGGLMRSAVRSRGAKADSVSLEPFNHLDLDISSTSVGSVRTALQAFFNAEAVGDGQAMRRLQVKHLPKVLVLNLKRFSFAAGKGGAHKISKPIKYEEKLVFDKSWLADDAASEEYFVTALICHHGEQVNRGHYTCIVRYNAEWYLYDDTNVRKIEFREVGAQQHTVYLLVYQARSSVSMAP